jgi:cytochrome b subunit of formate dehydrogenase
VDGVSFHVASRPESLLAVVHVRNDSADEVRVTAVRYTDSGALGARPAVEPWGRVLAAGERDSLRLAMDPRVPPSRVEVSVEWERILRTRVPRTRETGPPSAQVTGPPAPDPVEALTHRGPAGSAHSAGPTAGSARLAPPAHQKPDSWVYYRHRIGGSLSATGGLSLRCPSEGRPVRFSIHPASAILGLFLAATPLSASDHETCWDCHNDPDLDMRRGAKTISLHVDPEAFERSVHAGLDCTDCHADVDAEDLPHDEGLQKVLCGDCHDDAQTDYDIGIHGTALAQKLPHAPDCSACHGHHDVLSPADPESPTYKTRIPYLCGGCHREGAPVAQLYDISEHNIIDNYSQSIHGEGLFKKGLTVTATCTSCHESHRILPHTNPAASIAPRNVAQTCMKCHSRIEDVHEKIIRGELWETAPGAVPACTDCHLPHRVRKEIVAFTLSDRECLKCHQEPDVVKVAGADTLSMQVDQAVIKASVHANLPCVKCHTDIDPRRTRPCETSGPIDCSNCHAKISEEYTASGHGQARAAGNTEAPVCTTCHGGHGVLDHTNEDAETFRAAVPALCGDCHREGGNATHVEGLTQADALADYSRSVHGRGLVEKGLLPSAICIDCHSSHLVLKHGDPRSTVNPDNIAATCATCHRGIYKQFIKSVHFSPDGDDRKEALPNCADCHSSHTIGQVEGDRFLKEVTGQCGSCHQDLAATYLETMHGKAYHLGFVDAAKCSDCHGAHEILSVDDPHSSVGVRNIVETCRKCHEDANRRFTGYLTHATHHDPVRYPVLFYTYWSMTGLLMGTFTFFGLHTLMWMPRSFRELGKRRTQAKAAAGPRYYIRRFSTAQRLTHLFVILSFLSLAFTGMMLRFSTMPWAENVANLLGGVRNAGIIHRVAATVTFGYFLFHLVSLARFKRSRRLSLRELTLGPKAMMFGKKDIQDFLGTLKWFFGKGPRPEYGRWTYWEKFDYLAVFWGVAIIGTSGLLLWFPEFFTRFVPGWLINVATIVHSDEALLAVGFIFTIHFFNTHLRPDVFPMDTVVFTGLTDLEHYRKDRPAEYAEMKRTGELKRRLVKTELSPRWMLAVRVFGFTMLGFGLCLIALILYSVLSGAGIG